MQRVCRQVSVPLSASVILVPQHAADDIQWHSIVNHGARCAVAQVVQVHVIEASRVHGATDQALQPYLAELER